MSSKKKYQIFLRSISVNKIAKLGMVLATSSFITFLFLELLRFSGILSNAYIGLITYLSLPLIFVVGIILIPFGWFQEKKNTGKSIKEILYSSFDESDTAPSFFGSKTFNLILISSFVSIIFLTFSSIRMLHFMDEPEFCGTACHSTMNPEWVTYQNSPHSRVRCVDCHVGEGVGALVDSKINGTWQMISITFDLYEKPIPTPVHNLRPSRETCEKCHWPEKFYGNKLKTMVKYDFDEKNTPSYTTLNLKIDSGEKVGNAGIHWHVNSDNKITYASVDDKREKILWVKVENKDGSVKEFRNKKQNSEMFADGTQRVMDCVDCHNRATHIYENPEKAIDQRMAIGLIDNKLPFIKKVGLEAITKTFPDKDYSVEYIKQHVENFYRKNYTSTWATFSESIDKATEVLQSIYKKNIHPSMNIEWGSYPNHLGHEGDGGCFRCHNNSMVEVSSGKAIPYDCTTCHSILAYDSEEPYQYLNNKLPHDGDSLMQQYLQQEFLNSIKRN